VNVEALRFAFSMLAPDSPAAGAELVVEEEPACCRCRECGGSSEVRDPFAPCPRCGGMEVTIEGGRELLLSSLEVEVPEGKEPGPAEGEEAR
jgi:hydrogenase nickel incorporation protein HypA/HybF